MLSTFLIWGAGNVAGFFRLFPRTLPVPGKVTAITGLGCEGDGQERKGLFFFFCCGPCDAKLS